MCVYVTMFVLDVNEAPNRAVRAAVISTTMHAWTKYGMDARRSMSHSLALFGCEPWIYLGNKHKQTVY